ncbi:MAG: hypothetical protein ACK5LR_00230 [Mangrovibacterium sp.]
MIDNKLRSHLQGRMGDYKHSVGEDLWASIQQEAQRKKRKRGLVLWLSVAAAMLLGALLIFPVVREDTATAPPVQLVQEELELELRSEECEMRSLAHKVWHMELKVTEANLQDWQPILLDEMENKTSEEPAEEVQDEPEKESNPLLEEQELEQMRRMFASEEKEKEEEESGFELVLAMNGNNFSSGVNASRSSAMQGSSGQNNGLQMRTRSVITASSAVQELSGLEYLANHDLDFSFSMPLNLLLTARKMLDENWGIESGVSYTYLGAADGQLKMQLHYLGVPVKGIYAWAINEETCVYASAGLIAEWQVKGELWRGNHMMELPNKRLQFSTALSVGVDVNIAPQVKLFAEPGVAYFFDDGSVIPTIRKERPFNFNFQMGVRIDVE